MRRGFRNGPAIAVNEAHSGLLNTIQAPRHLGRFNGLQCDDCGTQQCLPGEQSATLWRRQFVAIGLIIIVGAIVLIVMFLLFLGVQIGHWIARQVGMKSVLTAAWPYYCRRQSEVRRTSSGHRPSSLLSSVEGEVDWNPVHSTAKECEAQHSIVLHRR